jgi:hypothetical protein
MPHFTAHTLHTTWFVKSERSFLYSNGAIFLLFRLLKLGQHAFTVQHNTHFTVCSFNS